MSERREHRWFEAAGVALAIVAAMCVQGTAVQDAAPAGPPAASSAPASASLGPAAPADYLIGTDDVLSILFWRDKDLSAPDIIVRPDGKVTLPLLNDVQAAGLTPQQLREAIQEAARKYVEDPNPTVIVKEIKSRRVSITGQVDKPGPYPLNGRTTILQLIAIAGGLKEFADGKNISLMRTEDGRQVIFPFNYQDVLKKRNPGQNIELKPGDTLVVP